MSETTLPTPASDRDEAIAIIKSELRRRSGKTWSVKGGRGTAWGWITISAPPKRLDETGGMTPEDSAELGALLGLGLIGVGGESIPAGQDYRIEYVDRARGIAPTTVGTPYWD